MAQPSDIPYMIDAISRWYGVPYKLALAMATIESGLNPAAVGDNGDSVGLCQLNAKGMGAGLGDLRYNPAVNLGVAIEHLANTDNTGLSWGQWAAKSQRPYDPIGYAQQIDDMLDSLNDGPISGYETAIAYLVDNVIGEMYAVAKRIRPLAVRQQLTKIYNEALRVKSQYLGS